MLSSSMEMYRVSKTLFWERTSGSQGQCDWPAARQETFLQLRPLTHDGRWLSFILLTLWEAPENQTCRSARVLSTCSSAQQLECYHCYLWGPMTDGRTVKSTFPQAQHQSKGFISLFTHEEYLLHLRSYVYQGTHGLRCLWKQWYPPFMAMLTTFNPDPYPSVCNVDCYRTETPQQTCPFFGVLFLALSSTLECPHSIAELWTEWFMCQSSTPHHQLSYF